jgi:hypothetical protein
VCSTILRRDVVYAVCARCAGRRDSPSSPCSHWPLGIGRVTIIYSVLRNVVLDPFSVFAFGSDGEPCLDMMGRRRLLRGPYYSARGIPRYYQEQADVFGGCRWHECRVDALGHGCGRERLANWLDDGPTDSILLGVYSPCLAARSVRSIARRRGRRASCRGDESPRAWMRLFNGDPTVVWGAQSC